MKVKICGMKFPNNILEISSLLPDYLGFIFYNQSTRFFDDQIPELPSSIKKVGVFVNESLDEIVNKIETHRLDLVQLHGQESPEFCNNLKHLPIEIIKVFSIDDDFNFQILDHYEAVCDYFLFDTKGKLHGGNGFTFNWEILKNYKSKKPLFLSGGIGLEELKKIEKLNLKIFAIDANSKLEDYPGLKNIELSKSFINNSKILNL